ncbi:hypothetical protein Tco_0696722 [Tanacetum coccineum]
MSEKASVLLVRMRLFRMTNMDLLFYEVGFDVGLRENDVLSNIPCSPECKIMGQLLLDHPLSHAITATANVPAVYLQQFLEHESSARFQILKTLSVETPVNPFIAPAPDVIRTIFADGGLLKEICDKKKKRIQVAEETSSLRKSLKVTIKQKQERTTPIPPPSYDKERDEIVKEKFEEEEIANMVEGDVVIIKVRVILHLRSSAGDSNDTHHCGEEDPYVGKRVEIIALNVFKPKSSSSVSSKGSTFLGIPIVSSTSSGLKAKEGDEDEESYASEFADSMLNDDDNSGTRIEPKSHKENPKNVDDDDDENDKEKKDEGNRDDAEDKDNDDHSDHTLVESKEIGSIETRKEKMQTPILSPTRCPRTNLSSDKTLSQELTESVSPSTAKSSKAKRKSRFISRKCKIILRKMTVAKTNEMIKEAIPRLVDLAVTRDREIAPTNEYFSNYKITEVVRVTTDQQQGLDYMEQIIVMRKNDKPDSFSVADLKYLNKNDIDDLYYLCLNKKVNFSHDPYSIVDKPNTGLIYLNNKEEKRVVYLAEIVKFGDATLERVSKEVKLKIFKSKP